MPTALCLQFNASDVLKEISVYDTIDSKGRYSVRVRRLGEFCRNRHVRTPAPIRYDRIILAYEHSAALVLRIVRPILHGVWSPQKVLRDVASVSPSVRTCV